MKRVVTFWYDDDAGEVNKVDYGKDFIVEPFLVRADVLGECLGELSNVYQKTWREFERDFWLKKGLKKNGYHV